MLKLGLVRSPKVRKATIVLIFAHIHLFIPQDFRTADFRLLPTFGLKTYLCT